MATTTAIDDPYDWDVDQLVRDLCTENRSWQPISPLLPDPVELENILRSHGINGPIFLNYVDEATIEQKWGIVIDAQKFNLIHCIEQLRLLSPKWLDWEQRSLAHKVSRRRESLLASDLGLRRNSSIGGATRRPSSVLLPNTPLKRSASAADDGRISVARPIDPGENEKAILESDASPELHEGPRHSPRAGESWTVNDSGKKRRRLDPAQLATTPLTLPTNTGDSDISITTATNDALQPEAESLVSTEITPTVREPLAETELDTPNSINAITLSHTDHSLPGREASTGVDDEIIQPNNTNDSSTWGSSPDPASPLEDEVESLSELSDLDLPSLSPGVALVNNLNHEVNPSDDTWTLPHAIYSDDLLQKDAQESQSREPSLPAEDQLLEDHEQMTTSSLSDVPDPRSDPFQDIPEVSNTTIKKPRRIAPTLLTTEPVRNASPSVSLNGDELENTTGHDQEDLDLPMSQLSSLNSDLFLSDEDNFPKRLHEAGERGLQAAHGVLQDAQAREQKQLLASLSLGYLGKEKMAIDKVFYGESQVGHVLEDIDMDEPLTQILPLDISSGRRLYVHKAVRRYLQAPLYRFHRGNKRFAAIQPYPTRLVQMIETPGLTVFETLESGEIKVTKENALNWPEVRIVSDKKSELLPRSNLANLVDMMSGDQACYLDDAELHKWVDVEGGDEELPVLGESDSDDFYDSEHEKELEEEGRVREASASKSKRNKLSSEEIELFLFEKIAAFRVKWHEKELPKLIPTAWSLWNRCQKQPSFKKMTLKSARQQLARLRDERLPKLQARILETPVASKREVSRLAGSLERSIYDQEACQWRIGIIKSKKEPERITPPTKKKRTRKHIASEPVGEQEELIGSDATLSDADSATNDGDLDVSDDFISHDSDDIMSDSASENDSEGSTPDMDSPNQEISPIPEAMGVRKIHLRLSSNSSNELGALPGKQQQIRKLKIKLSRPVASSELAATAETFDSDDDIRPPVQRRPRRKSSSDDDEDYEVDHGSDSDETKSEKASSQIRLPESSNMPNLSDPDAISRYSFAAYAQLKDRERLIIAIIHSLKPEARHEILKWFATSRATLWDILTFHLSRAISSPLFQEVRFPPYLRNVARHFEMWIDCRHSHAPRKESMKIGDAKALLKKMKTFEHWFEPFFSTLHDLRRIYEDNATHQYGVLSDTDLGNSENASALIHSSARKPRKRKVWEDRGARKLREDERARQKADERRRQILRERLKHNSQNVEDLDPTRIIINEGKYDNEGFIYINELASRRIKEHQIDGVRFMWSQIVTRERDVEQGCLLAHTMGLGKTMQVITLLVAIDQAAHSEDETVSSQIPEHIRESKTLVLAPSSLLDNWDDELVKWTPEGALGTVRKIVATQMNPDERSVSIQAWYEEGGILLISYEVFRSIIENKRTARSEPMYAERQAKVVQNCLLEGPNIIIADEAHRMKNRTALITQVTSLFRSKTRIALTGSPLANNVEEYHTMIDWVAPNLLGPAKEFKAKYVDPIEAGLWLDSTRGEQRLALKMLYVLNAEVKLKVHRADMSVLADDLPPKHEFIITVPLTELQRKAYSLYVTSMANSVDELGGLDKSGKVKQTTLWGWLSMLSLLCNHPSCVKSKLSDKKKGVKASKKDADSEDQRLAPVWDSKVSDDIFASMQSLLDENIDLQDINHSYKVRALDEILNASKRVGDKVLVFTHSIPTLNYLDAIFRKSRRAFLRLDGSTEVHKRQNMTKVFNEGKLDLILISTTAGGQGLNLQGANRVVIFDFKWNPMHEEQSVGRAYRIGQQKTVYVYRFISGGTFEQKIHSQSVFKMQLASRVVDKKNPVAWAKRQSSHFLFEPQDVPQSDIKRFTGEDPDVLDKLLAMGDELPIREIIETDTFARVDNQELSVEEHKEAQQLIAEAELKRTDPEKYNQMMWQRKAEENQRRTEQLNAQINANHVHASNASIARSTGKQRQYNWMTTTAGPSTMLAGSNSLTINRLPPAPPVHPVYVSPYEASPQLQQVPEHMRLPSNVRSTHLPLDTPLSVLPNHPPPENHCNMLPNHPPLENPPDVFPDHQLVEAPPNFDGGADSPVPLHPLGYYPTRLDPALEQQIIASTNFEDAELPVAPPDLTVQEHAETVEEEVIKEASASPEPYLPRHESPGTSVQRTEVVIVPDDSSSSDELQIMSWTQKNLPASPQAPRHIRQLDENGVWRTSAIENGREWEVRVPRPL